MSPWQDQTGPPHFHSSTIAGSAARMRARSFASISPRQSPSSLIRWSMSLDAAAPLGAALFLAAAMADRSARRARTTPLGEVREDEHVESAEGQQGEREEGSVGDVGRRGPPMPMKTKLAMTVRTKRIETQRWACRIR